MSITDEAYKLIDNNFAKESKEEIPSFDDFDSTNNTQNQKSLCLQALSADLEFLKKSVEKEDFSFECGSGLKGFVKKLIMKSTSFIWEPAIRKNNEDRLREVFIFQEIIDYLKGKENNP
ncbi:MAG: hypothetical protein K6F84_04730 [Lachnospiraceae bacterium]|nr:hypothetical protein [Lachnospiraceae bacterium]